MRGGENRRVIAPLPLEVQPMVEELNALLAHNEKQAEEARLHAGNLAHALKTPLTLSLIHICKGQVRTTGKLCEVMTESVQAALSFVKARAPAYGIKPSLFARKDIHIHLPEGAVPKDGPSAGVGMVPAMVSTLTGIAAVSYTHLAVYKRKLRCWAGTCQRQHPRLPRTGLTASLPANIGRRPLPN